VSPEDRIADEVRQSMQSELRAIAEFMSGILADGWGFGVVIFPFGADQPLLWISNAKREHMVKAMAEFVEKNGGNVAEMAR
jgi:hypothetical protein